MHRIVLLPWYGMHVLPPLREVGMAQAWGPLNVRGKPHGEFRVSADKATAPRPQDVYIPMDFHTRQPKPFAFIEVIT